MSRASDFTLFLILLQGSLAFVDATGMFSSHYLGTPDNNASYTIQNLNDYRAIEDQSVFDEVRVLAQWAFDGFFIGLKIVFTVIFIFPMLVDRFQIPLILSVFIQAGVYYQYAIFYSQFKSGKAWRFYE